LLSYFLINLNQIIHNAIANYLQSDLKRRITDLNLHILNFIVHLVWLNMFRLSLELAVYLVISVSSVNAKTEVAVVSAKVTFFKEKAIG